MGTSCSLYLYLCLAPFLGLYSFYLLVLSHFHIAAFGFFSYILLQKLICFLMKNRKWVNLVKKGGGGDWEK